MSDTPIDLAKRRKLMQRMGALEKEFRALKGALVSPEQLATLALGEAQKFEKHFAQQRAALEFVTPWLLEQMALYGAWLKLSGKNANPSPTDALAFATKNTSFCNDRFAASVQERIAQLEDEIQVS